MRYSEETFHVLRSPCPHSCIFGRQGIIRLFVLGSDSLSSHVCIFIAPSTLRENNNQQAKTMSGDSGTIILYEDQASLKTKATDLANELNSISTAQSLATYSPNTATPVKKVGMDRRRNKERGVLNPSLPFPPM